jgi:dephospho-CoA kinase
MLADLAAHFGDGVITASGELDRAALAGLVFNDPERLKELNKLVHPPINREIARRTLEHRATDRVVLLDIPLLVEGGDRRYNTAANVVVDTPVDVAVERLVTHRGMSEADARARMARQVSREERLAKADRVIDNSGPPEALEAQLDDLWAWMQTLPAASPDDLAPYEQRIAEADGPAE